MSAVARGTALIIRMSTASAAAFAGAALSAARETIP
jgi:hypothetical protein